jgi:hypothetical protein
MLMGPADVGLRLGMTDNAVRTHSFDARQGATAPTGRVVVVREYSRGSA